MNPQEILQEIQSKGISIKTLGDKIILTPKGATGPELLAKIKAVKPQLLVLLGSQPRRQNPPNPPNPISPSLINAPGLRPKFGDSGTNGRASDRSDPCVATSQQPWGILGARNSVEVAVAELEADDREEWEERAAMKEAMAGMDKATAERRALVEVISGPPPADPKGEEDMDNEVAQEADWTVDVERQLAAAQAEPDVYERVPSESDPRVSHHVRRTAAWWSCSCKSFQFRGACQHIVRARAKVEGNPYGV